MLPTRNSPVAVPWAAAGETGGSAAGSGEGENWHHRLLAAALCFAFFLQGLFSLHLKSPIVDEPNHIVSGASYGLGTVYADQVLGARAFLGGQLKERFASYFAVAWLVKEPLATIALAFGGTWLVLFQRGRLPAQPPRADWLGWRLPLRTGVAGRQVGPACLGADRPRLLFWPGSAGGIRDSVRRRNQVHGAPAASRALRDQRPRCGLLLSGPVRARLAAGGASGGSGPCLLHL
jgi:hypothetical protein